MLYYFMMYARQTYKGPAVASEPETQAISNFFLSHPRIIAGIDFHSYSQLLLRPYGHTTKDSPHEAEHAAIGKIMSEIIEKQHGKVYTSMKSSELYAATGTANDWFYSEEVREKLGHSRMVGGV